ncbi:uncharacterized protein LOC110674042 isoform X1 [Aedes aegypti]|uniref:Uncharacterized protein n=1 Tax=Aedes aegypti TaxID=7159 RepID=A0A6I8TTX5_AEDAE|nr:uncharacterized protein LOC110674042 isoform X1 [Aedes aegypti]
MNVSVRLSVHITYLYNYLHLQITKPSHPLYLLVIHISFSNTSGDMVQDASFINIVTSTPSSTPLPEPRPEYQQTTFSALANESATTNKEFISKKRLFDCEDSKRLFKENDLEERRLYDSSSDCDDFDWNLDNVSDTTDGSHQEGDASDLADLSIYEYFQKYHTLDDLGSEYCLENANNESTEQVIVEGETATLPEHTGNTRRINISIQVVDDKVKECLEPIISKAEMRATNKRRKERGLEYTRPDGVIVRARELRPPCNCKRKCSEKYPDSIRSRLLEQLSSVKLSGQNQFLANHMVVSKTAIP